MKRILLAASDKFIGSQRINIICFKLFTVAHSNKQLLIASEVSDVLFDYVRSQELQFTKRYHQAAHSFFVIVGTR